MLWLNLLYKGVKYVIKRLQTLGKYVRPKDRFRVCGNAPSNFAPGKMMVNGEFKKQNGHSPEKPRRIWYEADINYKIGKRNFQRIVWPNDGLIFVSYDHYRTFNELV